MRPWEAFSVSTVSKPMAKALIKMTAIIMPLKLVFFVEKKQQNKC